MNNNSPSPFFPEVPDRTVFLTIEGADDTLLVVPFPSVDCALEVLTEMVGAPLESVPVRAQHSYGWKLYHGSRQVGAIVVKGSAPEMN